METTKPERSVRVVVADDHPTILRMVKQILADQPHIRVVGDATDGEQAVALVEELKPDVAVLNVVMPKLTGFQAARVIRQSVPQTKVVILSTHADAKFISLAESAEQRLIFPKRTQPINSSRRLMWLRKVESCSCFEHAALSLRRTVFLTVAAGMVARRGLLSLRVNTFAVRAFAAHCPRVFGHLIVPNPRIPAGSSLPRQICQLIRGLPRHSWFRLPLLNLRILRCHSACASRYSTESGFERCKRPKARSSTRSMWRMSRRSSARACSSTTILSLVGSLRSCTSGSCRACEIFLRFSSCDECSCRGCTCRLASWAGSGSCKSLARDSRNGTV